MANSAKAGSKVLLVIFCLLFLLFSWNTETVESFTSPTGPVLWRPIDYGYTDESSVTFTWFEVPGATKYSLKVWPYGLGNLTFFEDHNITGPSENGQINLLVEGFPVDGTCYQWQVKAFVDGVWSLPSTFRFSSGTPSPPLLLSPAYFDYVYEDQITLQWASSFYSNHLQVSIDNSFEESTLLVDHLLTSSITSYLLGNLPQDGRAYFWRVRVRNALSIYSQWSEPWIFISNGVVNNVPSPPDLLKPADGSFVDSFEVPFAWNAKNPDDFAFNYQFQVSTSDHMDLGTLYQVNEFIFNSTEVQKIFPNTGDTYYWRVRATNSVGWSEWSEIQSFVNGPPPPPSAPTLDSPVKGIIRSDEAVEFSWDTPEHAIKYRQQVWADGAVLGYHFDQSNIEGNHYTVVDFPVNGTRFNWRVQAYSDGGWGVWSSTEHFYSGSPVDTGSLQVFIEPHAARRAGAQWRLTAGPDQDWKSSGAIIDSLPVTKYTVEFAELEDWAKPDAIDLSVIKDQLATATGTYTTPIYVVVVSANPPQDDQELPNVVTGAGDYQSGQSVTVTATPAPGCEFVSWTERGMVVSTKSSYSFKIYSNRSLVANFKELEVEPEWSIVNLLADPEGGGRVSGGGVYEPGERVVITATANSGFEFISWTDDDNNIVSTKSKHQFNIGFEELTLYANFQLVEVPQFHNIEVDANPAEGGRVRGGGIYEAGEIATVTAAASNGYSFAYWAEGGKVVSKDAGYKFVMGASDRKLVAYFQETSSYSVTVTAEPPEGGKVGGGGEYEAGATVTVTAAAATGYSFAKWTEGGNTVSTDQNYTFRLESNRKLVANFDQQEE